MTHEGPIVYGVERVPGTYFINEPGRPWTICWPSGLWVLAKCEPVQRPTGQGVTNGTPAPARR